MEIIIKIKNAYKPNDPNFGIHTKRNIVVWNFPQWGGEKE